MHKRNTSNPFDGWPFFPHEVSPIVQVTPSSVSQHAGATNSQSGCFLDEAFGSFIETEICGSFDVLGESSLDLIAELFVRK